MKNNTIFKYCISLAMSLALSSNLCASYYIDTKAGSGTAGFYGDNGPPATNALFYNPSGICADSSGNIYVADTVNGRIRKFTIGGGISTVAGSGIAGFSGDGALATSAKLNNPRGICADSSDNIYIADTFNHCIRKITASNGYISTIAGTRIAGFTSDSSLLATSTMLNCPSGICADNSGNIYIADTGNNRIRMIWNAATDATHTQGYLNTILGSMAIRIDTPSGSLFTYKTYLRLPTGVCADSSGYIYFTGAAMTTPARNTGNGYFIGKTSKNGGYALIAGANASAGYGGDSGLATATAVMFNNPFGICVDSSGNLYIADTVNNRIRMIWNAATNSTYTSGYIYTIAGTGTAGYSGDGGAATAAVLNNPRGIYLDNSGNILIADTANNCIRILTQSVPASHGLQAVRPLPFYYMNIVVYGDYTNSAAVSGYLEANLIRKIGGGTAVVSGNNSGVQRLQIDEGLVQVNVTENMGGAVAFAGGNLEVTSGTVIVPSVAMDANGTLTADAGTAVTLTTLSGDSVLSIAGAGEVTAGDMSLNSTPVFITGTMITGTFGSNMTKGATTVANGGLLQLMDAIPTSVPGITEIQLGGKLQVLAGVSVPANDASNGDVFNDGETGGSLQFDAGSTLKLGNGSIWARDITVDAAL